MIRIPLHGFYGQRPSIVVELDDESHVNLIIEPEADTDDDITRYLVPDEARALAAMLVHYASEAERPR